tara:strand:- start:214 stop:420 length:207 start_codon:yes stop_codon:yes gene_type:complete
LILIRKKFNRLIKKSLISDAEIENFSKEEKLNFMYILDKEIAYKEADFVIIATPIDYILKQTVSKYHL